MSMRIILVSSAATLALVTACASSKSGNTAAGGHQSSATGSGTITSNSGRLIGPDGHTLYVNTVDTTSKITCTDQCASLWPPVTGTQKAGAGVDASKIGTATRPDGTKQLTYAG